MNKYALYEKRTALVNKLIAHWISQTKGQPATVQQFVDFLQQDKIQKALPYNAEVTDEIINDLSAASTTKDFGARKSDAKSSTTDTGSSGSGKGKGKGKGKGNPNPKQQQEYIARIKAVIDDLDPGAKDVIVRLLG